MYTERQYFKNAWARWLQTICAGTGLLQTAAFVGFETGMPWLPCGYAVHVCILVVAGLLFVLFSQAGLVLRVSNVGLSLRFFPYQWHTQKIGWNEVRHLRLLPEGELPSGARFGLPGRDFTHVYFIKSADLRVLNVTLVNGTQLYISTGQPTELLFFLQKELIFGKMAVLLRPT